MVQKQCEVLEDLMTMIQVCEFLNRSDVSVRVYMREKGMPHVKIPGDGRPAIRFRREKVRQWAEENDIEVVDRVRPSFGRV